MYFYYANLKTGTTSWLKPKFYLLGEPPVFTKESIDNNNNNKTYKNNNKNENIENNINNNKSNEITKNIKKNNPKINRLSVP
jgi:hypothetical protein